MNTKVGTPSFPTCSCSGNMDNFHKAPVCNLDIHSFQVLHVYHCVSETPLLYCFVPSVLCTFPLYCYDWKLPLAGLICLPCVLSPNWKWSEKAYETQYKINCNVTSKFTSGLISFCCCNHFHLVNIYLFAQEILGFFANMDWVIQNWNSNCLLSKW